jgi:hypothetical protein
MAETARVVDHTFGSPGVGTCLWPHMSESPDTFTSSCRLCRGS